MLKERCFSLVILRFELRLQPVCAGVPRGISLRPYSSFLVFFLVSPLPLKTDLITYLRVPGIAGPRLLL